MKDIRVFISSTFNDLVAERNKIMLAFREAERYAIENYVNLKTIDFRWGLPDGAHVMKSCLESINISKPYFLCILGDNYGSQPQWEDYEKEKGYLTLYNQFIEDNVFKATPQNNLSYTAMEVYFALSKDFGKENVRFLHLAYKKGNDSRQKGLIKYVKEKNYPVLECNTSSELVEEVKSFLWSIIDANSLTKNTEVPDKAGQMYCFEGFNEGNTQYGQLHLYRKNQEYLLNCNYIDSFQRKQERLLDDFVDSSSRICCIEGEEGSGKSTLVARWLKNKIEKNYTDEIIIYHFFRGGYTDDIFEHLYLELAEVNHRVLEDYYAELFGINEHFPASLSIFREALKQLETENQIIIVLDGLEHIVEGFLEDFFGLFSHNSIKLILTTGTSPVGTTDVKMIHLSTLEEDEVKCMISKYLLLHNKTKEVSNEVAEDIVVNQTLHNPKLLSSVLYDIRAFANHNNIQNKIAYYREAKDAMDIYTIIINDWEEAVPTITESDVLPWIAYSHYGLAEEEIKMIAGFVEDKEYLWHQLFSFIEPYIEWNGDRIQFSNRWLKEAVVKDNKENEKCIKNMMIQYFKKDSILIEKQFDELPYLLKEMGRYAELLSYILDISVFQYANEKNDKRDVLIDLWSNFELSDFSKYLDSSHEGIKHGDYVNFLYDLSDFIYFHGTEMFPGEERFDIEALHSMICERVIKELENTSTKELKPQQLANVYRIVAVSYMDSYKFKEAFALLTKVSKLLQPIVKRNWETYETTVKIQQTPELVVVDDKITIPYLLSTTRTAFLKVLNPYVDLLGEMINAHPSIQKAKKIYEEVLGWISILDQVKETNRNTSLLRSQIEYAYGMILHDEEEYLAAFENFNNSFNLKYDYLQKEEKSHRKDDYQEYRLMETYKMIESCQTMAGDSNLYCNQGLYVEAVEKYGKKHLDDYHYCSCLFNYAAFFYNQTVDKEGEKVSSLLCDALQYYDKVISKTKNSHQNSLYIRASFFKMMCLARLDQDDEISEICESILKRAKKLEKYERNDTQIRQILEICNSMRDE